MDHPVLTRVAYDRDRRVPFRAAVLAAATTHVPGKTRWTELTIYRTQQGSEEPARGAYVVARVGASVLVHRRTCTATDTRRMARYVGPPETRQPVACLICHPQLDPPAADAVLERTKNELLQCRDQQALFHVLLPRATYAALRGMTADAIEQLRAADADFDHWWASNASRLLTKE